MRISAWVTVPVGLATGLLAATIAVGGFIGVPGMIYVIGASAVVASATELGIAFIMGAWGSIQWGISGLIDIRLALLLLSTSLIGVQLGALGTTYVKDYMIKVVMATVMLVVAVSRGAKIPGYLADVGFSAPLDHGLASVLDTVSFWALVLALGIAGIIIAVAMVIGMMKDRAEKKLETVVSHGLVPEDPGCLRRLRIGEERPGHRQSDGEFSRSPRIFSSISQNRVSSQIGKRS